MCMRDYSRTMRIYFAASIRGGRQDKELYARLIKLLGEYGEVLTEHIGDTKLSEDRSRDRDSNQSIYDRDMAWLRSADIVVAEVTHPSLGVGYELAQAEVMGKPVLCLYRVLPERNVSAMVAGNPYFKVYEYVDSGLLEEVKELLDLYIK